MSDDKKPDRFEEKARVLWEEYEKKAGTIKNGSVDGSDYELPRECWDEDQFIPIIAQALREEAEQHLTDEERDRAVELTIKTIQDRTKSPLVSEEELSAEITARYGAPGCSTYIGEFWHQKREAFRDGAEWAMHMRATMELKKLWPNDEMCNEQTKNVSEPWLNGFMHCYLFLKEKLGVK